MAFLGFTIFFLNRSVEQKNRESDSLTKLRPHCNFAPPPPPFIPVDGGDPLTPVMVRASTTDSRRATHVMSP
jgi:hypothetical protein